MTIFLNIANRVEVTREANSTVQELLAKLRGQPPGDWRGQIIMRSITGWQARFPRAANEAAVAAFARALNLESGRGNGGMEVVECMRFLELAARKAPTAPAERV